VAVACAGKRGLPAARRTAHTPHGFHV